jgi:lactaldehyde dehydrogenase/glycolaldehyde dehydrogenase
MARPIRASMLAGRNPASGGADGRYGIYEYMETQAVYIQHG